jgi:hypothetical protein
VDRSPRRALLTALAGKSLAACATAEEEIR